MTIAKSEKRVEQVQARLAEIGKEKTNLERAPEREQQRLTQARADVADITDRIRASSGAPGELGAELADAIRESDRLERTLADLKRDTASALDKLNAEESRLRNELMKTNRDLAKARLSESVEKYQAILREALPLVDEIRKHASAAGVTLPHRSWDEQSVLIERGVHVAGGITITLR